MNEQAQEDRLLLLDFFSLGAWLHQYTATALYHEMQRVFNDKSIPASDRPRIQSAIRYKIFLEKVGSIKTLERLGSAISRRHTEGLSRAFFDHDTAQEFFTKVRDADPLSAASLVGILDLPTAEEIPDQSVQKQLPHFLESLAPVLARYAHQYDNLNWLEQNTYLINNIEAVNRDAMEEAELNRHSVYLTTTWPITRDSLLALELPPENVTSELEEIRAIAITLSNLCQLLIVLIDNDLDMHGPITTPTLPHDPSATASAPHNPVAPPPPPAKTSDDDGDADDA